jgi:hypothetical protein
VTLTITMSSDSPSGIGRGRRWAKVLGGIRHGGDRLRDDGFTLGEVRHRAELGPVGWRSDRTSGRWKRAKERLLTGNDIRRRERSWLPWGDWGSRRTWGPDSNSRVFRTAYSSSFRNLDRVGD